MFISRLSLKNFGPFESADFSFPPTGISVIYGANGSGKTQIIGAILAAAVGRRAIRIDKKGIGPTKIQVSIEEGDATEEISLVVSMRPNGEPVIERSTQPPTRPGHPGPLRLRLIAAVSGSPGPHLFLLGNSRSNPISAQDMEIVGGLLADDLKADRTWRDLRASARRKSSHRSGGQVSLGVLLQEFLERKRAPHGLPLIVDEFLWKLSDEARSFSIKLLESIAQTTQVLVLANRPATFSGAQITLIEGPGGGTRSLAHYNYFAEDQRPYFPTRRQTLWIRGRTFERQEDRTCEMKEVKGGNPVSSIKSVVDQYAVAFLNAGLPQEGAILWGIRDEDRKIVGVPLTDRMCDELRRVVTEKLHQITPPLSPTAYQIHLHPVTDGSDHIRDLYVVEVRIPATRRTLLFSTGSHEVYVKTDAGKKKLSAVEIQQELLRRVGIDPSF